MIGIPNPYPGCLIAFEGIDGSGKSTQLGIIQRMISNLRLPRRSVIATKEPNQDSEWGVKIYTELNKPNGLHLTDPMRFQTWYANDSRNHLRDVVIPALQAGQVVLTDRCRLSMVYAIQHWNADLVELLQMHWGILGQYFIWPDLIFVFNVPVAIALERLVKKGKLLDTHEQEIVLTRVASNYRIISAIAPHCQLIDGGGEPAAQSAAGGRAISQLLINKFPECKKIIEQAGGG